MQLITSANIACGAHAGDEATMQRTVRLALQYGVAVGAHPGYPDRANFGRVEMPLSPDEIERTVYEQIAALGALAAIAHVKPHGALYNLAARDAGVARAIAPRRRSLEQGTRTRGSGRVRDARRLARDGLPRGRRSLRRPPLRARRIATPAQVRRRPHHRSRCRRRAGRAPGRLRPDAMRSRRYTRRPGDPAFCAGGPAKRPGSHSGRSPPCSLPAARSVTIT